MMRPNMGKQISRPGKVSPDVPNPRSRALRPGGMKAGGKVHSDAAEDRKLIRAEIAKAERAEKPGMKCGGKVRR